jgi:hypothetical protein
MRARTLFAILLLGALAAPAAQGARRAGPLKLVRVPQDAKTLAAAIPRVADGGVIQLAAGTYPSPKNGFSIKNTRKGFTVRAAPGAAVVLDGGGSRALLAFMNSDRTRGKRVIFERLTFANGFSSQGGKSGGVTLSKAEALFRQCVFVANRADGPTGGGAVKVLEGSQGTFVNSRFVGNSSRVRGGAMSVRGEVIIQGGEFVGNRTNLPGHDPRSFGGAIMVLDGTLGVTGTRFEDNQAGWVGGAIYAIGNWDKGSAVVVVRSSFVENKTVSDPCCPRVPPESSTGGALHAEDLTTLRVERSLLLRNRAELGGAIDAYRAVVEITGSVLQGNQTSLVQSPGIGGAISIFSRDGSDASTGFGALNRRPGKLVVSQSLLPGGGEVARPSHRGGCVAAIGDLARMYGAGGLPPAGTLADNRARMELHGVVFADCNVGPGSDGSGGSGGAFLADLVDLVMEDSMVLASDAGGGGAFGGGGALRNESAARIVRSAFANNSATARGGALDITGSTVEVAESRFYRNDVVPGSGDPFGSSRGASIFSQPGTNPPRDVAGVVSSSAFADDLGLPLFEVDRALPPINAMRYDGNRFASALFGDMALINNLVAPGGVNVAGLNGLVRGATRKSLVPNFFVPALHEGALRVVPSPRSLGPGAAAPTASLLAYAWTGFGAQLAGQALTQRSGLLEVGPGSYSLVVDGVVAATVSVP